MKLVKKIGLSTAFSLVVANMIGTGVFTSLGFQLFDIHDYRTIILLWTVGGVIALLGSFAYSELSAAYPQSGGEYNFLSIAFGRPVGFLSGWISATIGFAAPIAAAAHAFSKYFGHVVPQIPPVVLSTIVIILITSIHCFKKQIGSAFQNYFTFGKITLIVLFIGFGLYFALKSAANGTSNLVQTNFIGESFSNSFWISLVYVSYAYSGWNASAYMAAEVEDAPKNVPRSLLWGTLVVMVLYIGLNFIFLASAPASELRGTLDVAFVAAKHIFGDNFGILFSTLISFFLISSISSMIMVGPRVVHRIGEDYKEFGFLAKKNRFDVPVRSIVFQSSIALILLWTAKFEFIVTCISFTLTLFTTLTAISVFVLRKKHPHIHRPVKAWGYPFTPIIFIIFNIWFMVFVIKDKFFESLTGLIITLIGLIIYFTLNFNRGNKNENK